MNVTLAMMWTNTEEVTPVEGDNSGNDDESGGALWARIEKNTE